MTQFFDVTLRLLEGFKENCFLFGMTLLMALPLGLIISFGSMSKFFPLKILCKTFVWIIRGTPLILQLFVVSNSVQTKYFCNENEMEGGEYNPILKSLVFFCVSVYE